MRKFRLKDFAGIAPKYEDNLPVDYGGGTAMAKVAKNCTLSSGKITPISSNLVVNAAVAQANSVVRFENNWYSGNDRYYLISRSSQADILYYLESGVLKKFIDEDQDGVNGDGSDTADVGQERPQQPGLADQKNGSMEADNYDYIITTVRNVGNLALGGEKETTTFDDWDAHYGTPYNVDYTGPNPPDGSVILAASASGGGTSEKHLDTFVSCASNIFSSTGGQGKIEDVDEVTPYDADFLQYLSQPPLAAQGIRDKRFTGLLEDLTVDVPFDAHITSVNVGFRYQHPAGTTGDALRMLLYYNGSWELHPDNHVMNTPIGGSWNDRIQSWATVPGTSDPWTRDDLYNLTGAGISFYYNQGSYSTVHVSHIWVRITYDLFTISGQIETVHDHGPTAVGGEEVTFHEDSQLRAGTSITFDGFGSVLGPDTGDSYTWVPLLGGAPFLDGDVIDAAAASYRYFRIRAYRGNKQVGCGQNNTGGCGRTIRGRIWSIRSILR